MKNLNRKQNKLGELQKRIDNLKKQAIASGGDLDDMLAVIEQHKKQKAAYESLQRQITEEQHRRETEIRAMILSKYETNMAKYNKIIKSELGQDMKPAAWKNILRNLSITTNIAVDDTLSVKEEIGLTPYKSMYITIPSKNLTLVIVKVQGHIFEMGSNDGDSNEKPIHTVSLRDFAIAKTQVTNAEFCAFLNEKGNQTEGGTRWVNLDGNYGDEKRRIYKSDSTFKVANIYEKHPLIYVSWYAASAYCRWLSEKTGQNWRLPTEAE